MIDESWAVVKRPAAVTFVVDTSASMLGSKLRRAKEGLALALASMPDTNYVGFVTFGDRVEQRYPIAPLSANRASLTSSIGGLKASGETALYDAIKAGVEMSAAAEAPPDAIRAVVVLTDGRANRGSVGLDQLVTMTSAQEIPIAKFRGFAEDLAVDTRGGSLSVANVVGTSLALPAPAPVQIFFVAIGKDADLDIGRILAGATGAEFEGTTEQDLAEVLEVVSKYF
jgi:Mg-chelatase subunit ChlD